MHARLVFPSHLSRCLHDEPSSPYSLHLTSSDQNWPVASRLIGCCLVRVESFHSSKVRGSYYLLKAALKQADHEKVLVILLARMLVVDLELY